MRRTVSSSGASRSARWATAGAAAISLVVAGLLAGLLPGHLPPGGRGPGIFFTTCGFAADAVTLELVDISVDGEPVVGGAGEVRLNAGQTLRIAVACRPPRAGARFRYSFDGGLSWSAATTDSVLAPQLPGSGTHRILLGAVDAQGTWQAESRYLVVRVAGSESAADERPPRAAGGVPWAALVLTALLAVAAGAAGAILFLRRAGPRRSSLARKTVPRGARLVADGAHERTGGRAADRGADAPGAAGHMRSEFAAGAPTGASPATPAGTSAGAPAPARAAAEPPAIDLTDVPREDLEEELTRLRTRVQDLLDATRRLRHANTELRQEVGFLEQSNRELRELQRRKDELMATLAHDIKNPAAAVAQLAELLQSYDLGAQDQQRFIADLMLTASRILRLSQEMSNAMVADVRTLPLDLKVDSIRPAVETVARIAQYAAARKNITIKVVLSANLPQIEMDGPRIEEVLDNLVSNAVKYSRPDSTVRVDVKGTPSHLTIEVTDAGLGLSQKDLDEAFQFGKKLSNAPTGGEDSTGVGLWVVRKIVEAHRGVVWVRSSPGKGSTFSVMLPTTQR